MNEQPRQLPPALARLMQEETLPAPAGNSLPVPAAGSPTDGTQLARLGVEDWYRDVPPEARKKATQKRDWVFAVDRFLDLTNVAGQRIHTQESAVAEAADERTYPLIAGKMSVYNYRGWRKKLIEAGNGLVPKWSAVDALVSRAGRCRQKPIKVEMYWEFTQDVLRLWLNIRKPKLSSCWRRVKARYERAGRDTSDYPDIGQIRDFIKNRLPKTTVIRFREGAKAYADTVRGPIRRDHTQWEPGDCLVSDHRRLDFFIRVPDPDRAGEWVARRGWITVVEDDRSRYVLSVLIYADTAPNHERILECLWNALLVCGRPPLVWYTDNGPDYLKYGFSRAVSLTSKSAKAARHLVNPATGAAYEHSVLNELCALHHLSRPYNGQEKVVEGTFGYVQVDYDRWETGYCGNNTVERQRLDKEAFSGDVMSLMTVGQAQASFDAWLEDYHNMETSSTIVDGRTRAEAWANRKPWRPEWSVEELDFAFLLPHAECPVVGRSLVGGVTFRGGLYSHAALRARRLWGKPVMVKTSWAVPLVPVGGNQKGRAPAKVWLFEPDGTFICEAPEEGYAKIHAETEEEKDDLANRAHLRNAAAALDTRAHEEVTGRLRACTDETEALAEIDRRLGLPAGAVVAQPTAPTRKKLRGSRKNPKLKALPARRDPDLTPEQLRDVQAVQDTVDASVGDGEPDPAVFDGFTAPDDVGGGPVYDPDYGADDHIPLATSAGWPA